MNRMTGLGLLGLLLFLFLLSGCFKATPVKERFPYIHEIQSIVFADESNKGEGSTITINCFNAAGNEQRESVVESELVLEWLESLDIIIERFEPGESPGDANGGMLYDVTVGFEKKHLFYIRSGDYLLYNGIWYTIEDQAYSFESIVEPILDNVS